MSSTNHYINNQIDFLLKINDPNEEAKTKYGSNPTLKRGVEDYYNECILSVWDSKSTAKNQILADRKLRRVIENRAINLAAEGQSIDDIFSHNFSVSPAEEHTMIMAIQQHPVAHELLMTAFFSFKIVDWKRRNKVMVISLLDQFDADEIADVLFIALEKAVQQFDPTKNDGGLARQYLDLRLKNALLEINGHRDFEEAKNKYKYLSSQISATDTDIETMTSEEAAKALDMDAKMVERIRYDSSICSLNEVNPQTGTPMSDTIVHDSFGRSELSPEEIMSQKEGFSRIYKVIMQKYDAILFEKSKHDLELYELSKQYFGIILSRLELLQKVTAESGEHKMIQRRIVREVLDSDKETKTLSKRAKERVASMIAETYNEFKKTFSYEDFTM